MIFEYKNFPFPSNGVFRYFSVIAFNIIFFKKRIIYCRDFYRNMVNVLFNLILLKWIKSNYTIK